MGYGRPTSDPKGEVIRVRLNTEMKDWLYLESSRRGVSVSQIIRDLIQKDMVHK